MSLIDIAAISFSEIFGDFGFTPLKTSNTHFIEPKNKKKCKINSRNFQDFRQ